jgi:cysteine-rich repeat protein
MRTLRAPFLALSLPCLLLVANGCNDDTSNANDEVGNDSSGTAETNDNAENETSDSNTGDGDGDPTGDGDGDQTGDGDGDQTGDGDGDQTGDGDGDQTGDGDGDGDGDPTGDGDGDPNPICGNGQTEPGEECDDGDQVDNNYCSNACAFVPCDLQMGGGNQEFDFTYIWVSNTGQGTVSKIHTQTLVEEGRYRTDPSSSSSPSRTAVNVNGRYAAVANRTANTVTVFAADEEYCIDKNNDNMIQTSTGANNVLAWEEDECMLWSITLNPSNNGANNRGPRPLGWDFADQDPISCEWQTHNLWLGWYPDGQNGYFWYVNGEDGSLIQEVVVNNWGGNNWGPYGGAVDSQHNFWVTGWHGPLVRINSDFTYDMWNSPLFETHDSYGMALDAQGHPWIGGCSGQVLTFDPDNEQVSAVGVDTGGCLRGLMVDSEDRAWIAGNGSCRLVEVDTANNTVINPNIPIPGCSTPVGISIDVDGFVWIVDQNGTAFKMDPDTYQIVDSYTGLASPYTYSDMTGGGIALQVMPQ